jgi:hypothetical protein
MEKRQYNLSDAAMLTFASMHRHLFITYQADFTAFDSDFASPDFETDWQAAIDASLMVGTAETRDDQLGIHTAHVNTAMKAITLKVKEVKYFANKAFPPSASEQNRRVFDKFGFDDYQEVYGSQEGMRVFMKSMFKAANQHAAALAAKGFTPTMLAEINTLTDTFIALDATQDSFNTLSPIDTNARVVTHNTTWGFSQRVREAAEVIYAENPLLYNIFLFPRRTENPSVYSVVGNVSSMGVPVAGATVQIVELNMTTTTDQDGNFGLAQVAPGNYNLKVSAAGFALIQIPFTREQTKQPTVVNASLPPSTPPPPMPPMP